MSIAMTGTGGHQYLNGQQPDKPGADDRESLPEGRRGESEPL